MAKQMHLSGTRSANDGERSIYSITAFHRHGHSFRCRRTLDWPRATRCERRGALRLFSPARHCGFLPEGQPAWRHRNDVGNFSLRARRRPRIDPRPSPLDELYRCDRPIRLGRQEKATDDSDSFQRRQYGHGGGNLLLDLSFSSARVSRWGPGDKVGGSFLCLLSYKYNSGGMRHFPDGKQAAREGLVRVLFLVIPILSRRRSSCWTYRRGGSHRGPADLSFALPCDLSYLSFLSPLPHATGSGKKSRGGDSCPAPPHHRSPCLSDRG